MLARINPPLSSAGGAAALSNAENRASRRTNAQPAETATNDGDENPPAGGTVATRQVSPLASLESRTLPEIQDSSQAAQCLSFLQSKMLATPATALAAHGNLTADNVLSLADE
jgi:hypothetical protein